MCGGIEDVEAQREQAGRADAWPSSTSARRAGPAGVVGQGATGRRPHARGRDRHPAAARAGARAARRRRPVRDRAPTSGEQSSRSVHGGFFSVADNGSRSSPRRPSWPPTSTWSGPRRRWTGSSPTAGDQREKDAEPRARSRLKAAMAHAASRCTWRLASPAATACTARPVGLQARGCRRRAARSAIVARRQSTSPAVPRFAMPGQDEQQVREPVEVGRGQRVHRRRRARPAPPRWTAPRAGRRCGRRAACAARRCRRAARTSAASPAGVVLVAGGLEARRRTLARPAAAGTPGPRRPGVHRSAPDVEQLVLDPQ